MRFFRGRNQSGLSLIETLASLLVFSLVTLGVIPLITSSIRGAAISRSQTIAKNTVVKAMERVRGLPYQIAYGVQQKRVDILDLYFPAANGTNRTVTTCTPSSATSACPAGGIPNTLTNVTYDAAFVEAIPNSAPERYRRIPQCSTGNTPPAGFNACVPSTYIWNVAGRDTPPVLLMEMIITANWTVGGVNRSFELRSLIGERVFGGLKAKGRATINYVINTTMEMEDSRGSGGSRFEAEAVAANLESRVEARRQSTAAQSIRTVDLSLTDTALAVTDPNAALVGFIEGARDSQTAPPDVDPAADVEVSAPNDCVGVPADNDCQLLLNGTVVGEIDRTATDDVIVTMGAETPRATGEVELRSTSNARDDYTLFNRDADQSPPFSFDKDEPMVSVPKIPSTPFSLTAETNAQTLPLGSGVVATATASVPIVTMLTTRNIVSDGTYDDAVIAVRNFTMNASCKATTTGVAATAPDQALNYTATFTYWNDPTPNDQGGGSYVDLPLGKGLSTSPTADPFAALQATNPLVEGHAAPAQRMYLFDDPAAGKEGYLVDANSAFGRTVDVSTASSGRIASATLEPMIDLQTVNLERGEPDTTMSVLMGSMGCDVEDRR